MPLQALLKDDPRGLRLSPALVGGLVCCWALRLPTRLWSSASCRTHVDRCTCILRTWTALHFACASGHPKVVTLLVKRKCDINACDSENSTALIKAVQWHQEECVTVLLEHGANPNVADASGNTALHYAVCSENTSIAAKLLSHHADTEAKNKDDLTPYLLALRENRQQVAELFIKAETNIHAVDEVERFSSKPGPGDLQPGLDEDDCNFNNKNVPQINLTERWAAPQQSRKNPKYGIGEPGNRTLLDDTISDRENKDVVKTLSETSLKIQSFSQSSFSSSAPDPKSIFENLPQKSVDHLSGAADEKGKHTRNIQVEESPEKCLHLKPTIEMKDSVPNKAVAVEDLQTCKSDFLIGVLQV